MQGISGIDLSTWQVTLLPYPKRFSRGKALGFCGGQPVGAVESARGKSAACWWPGGRPELMTLPGYKEVRVLFARGDAVPGSWTKGSGEKIGAAFWGLGDGQLVGTDLHDPRFERTWAEAVGGGLVVGVGVHKGRLGARPPDSGLVWFPDGRVQEIATGRDVCLRATDGVRLAGTSDGRAALWPTVEAPPLDLAPDTMPASEICALDGDTQVGIAFKALAARAVVWRGSAGSVVDLTPDGYAESRAFDAARGYQVGLVLGRSNTRNGSAACDERAALWQGTSDRWFDLNALLPEPYNASTAWAIHFEAERVLVCGEATRFEVSDAGTPRESHYVPKAQAVVWSARLSG